jgi:hypothetical protein
MLRGNTATTSLTADTARLEIANGMASRGNLAYVYAEQREHRSAGLEFFRR